MFNSEPKPHIQQNKEFYANRPISHHANLYPYTGDSPDPLTGGSDKDDASDLIEKSSKIKMNSRSVISTATKESRVLNSRLAENYK